jgi:hypothetical protein
MIMIFSGGAGNFVKGLFGAGCAGKMRALCTPQGLGDDANHDGISDSASFILEADDGSIAAKGQCSTGSGTSFSPTTDYQQACNELSKKNKELAKGP